FRLVSCNESVERILQHDFDDCIGKPLTTIPGLEPFAESVMGAFSEQSARAAGEGGVAHWQKQIEVPRRTGGPSEVDNNITLLTRGSYLPVSGDVGHIVVFDDITEVISAQRSIAWAEVARRLAHEIKNPLTPIQLSAERLQMKLETKLEPADKAVLSKGTGTIVSQVSAMKRMVDDFRDYAKTPAAVLVPLDLNALVEEILQLYMADIERGVIHPRLTPELPLVMGDATQLRQVIHNLLQNALDAVGDADNDAPFIEVLTETVHYQHGDGSRRTAVRLCVTDNGPGFSPKILARACEPYVTNKPRGTGLGLAVVKKIVEEHGGRIDIRNRSTGSGAKVAILLMKLSGGQAPEATSADARQAARAEEHGHGAGIPPGTAGIET
ncbi:MAG TPA: ATP-binding protein, partial [Noviherbaspirillum sp.]|nr:ATP-binding protein [Noviherbaspirillum sp.]